MKKTDRIPAKERNRALAVKRDFLDAERLGLVVIEK
jgi:hypothetical protein